LTAFVPSLGLAFVLDVAAFRVTGDRASLRGSGALAPVLGGLSDPLAALARIGVEERTVVFASEDGDAVCLGDGVGGFSGFGGGSRCRRFVNALVGGWRIGDGVAALALALVPLDWGFVRLDGEDFDVVGDGGTRRNLGGGDFLFVIEKGGARGIGGWFGGRVGAVVRLRGTGSFRSGRDGFGGSCCCRKALGRNVEADFGSPADGMGGVVIDRGLVVHTVGA